jgi:hypothetical protein
MAQCETPRPFAKHNLSRYIGTLASLSGFAASCMKSAVHGRIALRHDTTDAHYRLGICNMLALLSCECHQCNKVLMPSGQVHCKRTPPPDNVSHSSTIRSIRATTPTDHITIATLHHVRKTGSSSIITYTITACTMHALLGMCNDAGCCLACAQYQGKLCNST